MEISETGKWVDNDGNVVDSQPEEGHLLVRPGAEITPDVKRAIEKAEAAAPVKPQPETDPDPADDAPAEDADGGDPDKTVTTKKAGGKR